MNNRELEKFCKNIADELCTLDSDLKSHRAELEKIIKEMVLIKPKIKLDTNFKEKLKVDLLARASEIKENVHDHKNKNKISNFLSMKKFTYAFSGAAIALLITIPLTYHFVSQQNKPSSLGSATNESSDGVMLAAKDSYSNFNIKESAPNAFGSLAGGASTPSGTAGLGGGANLALKTQEKDLVKNNNAMIQPSDAPSNIGVATSGGEEEAPQTDSIAADDVSKEEARIMPVEPIAMPAPETVDFEYTGEEFAIPSEVDVYKKTKNDLSADFGYLAKEFGLGVIDTSQFSDLNLQNISFTEDKEFGLGLYVDLMNHNITINKNYNLWPNPVRECTDEACFENKRLKASDLPNDAKTIALANEFLDKFGIDKNNYADPVIQDSYKNYLEDKNYWIPEEISVVYPLLVNNEEVFDEWGNPTGLNVNIDVRQKKASGAYNIFTGNFESSTYEAETDKAEILKFAEQGGRYPFYIPYDQEIDKLELDTPEKVLMRHFVFKNGKTEEYYVPALAFPIKNASELKLDRKKIIIPLAKELLEESFDIVRPANLLKSSRP